MSPFFFSLLMQKALKQANDAKEEGNKLFRTGQYEDALLKYELALQISSEVTSSVDVCSMCHGNRAACFLKLVSHSFKMMMMLMILVQIIPLLFCHC